MRAVMDGGVPLRNVILKPLVETSKMGFKVLETVDSRLKCYPSDRYSHYAAL